MVQQLRAYLRQLDSGLWQLFILLALQPTILFIYCMRAPRVTILTESAEIVISAAGIILHHFFCSLLLIDTSKLDLTGFCYCDTGRSLKDTEKRAECLPDRGGRQR
jgi:hypothetical protein